MKDYFFGAIIGSFVLIGATGGYYFRDYFPPVTRLVHRDDEFSKSVTGVLGGATIGFIGGIPAAIAIRFFTNNRIK